MVSVSDVAGIAVYSHRKESNFPVGKESNTTEETIKTTTFCVPQIIADCMSQEIIMDYVFRLPRCCHAVIGNSGCYCEGQGNLVATLFVFSCARACPNNASHFRHDARKMRNKINYERA